MDTASELMHGDIMTLNDTQRCVLVEPPFERLPDWAPRALGRIVEAGFQPVLAHPERNADIQRDPSLVRAMVDAGAYLQLTAMSVSGDNGPKALFAANWIMDQGLASVISSDCHGASWRPPTMRRAFHAVRRRLGIDMARLLCIINPRAVIFGTTITPARPSVAVTLAR